MRDHIRQLRSYDDATRWERVQSSSAACGQRFCYHAMVAATVLSGCCHAYRRPAFDIADARIAALFLAPGMHHCLTGPGPNVFNGAGNYGGARDARHDVLSALDAWVTSSGTRSPEKIIATKYVELPNDADGNPVLGPLIMTRPLCPYPQRAQYAGPGAISEASSFKCIDGWHNVGQVPAQQYQQ